MEYKPIILTIGSGNPIVTVIGGMHGNEQKGIRVIESLVNSITLKRGTLRLVIANPPAVSQGIRFIQQDLNRSFPGKKKGNIEESLAYNLVQLCKNSTILLDFHTCPTPTSAFAITRGTKEQLELARICNIDRCVSYPLPLQGGASLIDYVPCGIGFELGTHADSKAVGRGMEIVKRVLASYRMVEEIVEKEKVMMRTFQVTDTLTRIGEASLEKGVRNFKLIKMGEVYGMDNGKELIAKKEFIPILFAVREYNMLIGLQAQEIHND